MRKQYTAAFKAKIVHEALREQKTLAQLATEHDLHPNLLLQWKQSALEGLPRLFERESQSATDAAVHQEEVGQLHQEIGRLTLEVNWLKKTSGLDRDALGAFGVRRKGG